MSSSNDSRLAYNETSFTEIPVVDIEKLIDGSDPHSVACKIGDICENIGFLYVKNHGVPERLIEDIYRVSKEFFARPFEEKDKLNIVKSGPSLRGYIPMYAENVDPENTRDFKEGFDLARHEEKVSPFFGPNQMPEDFPEFKAVCEAYHQAMTQLAKKLIGALALSLDLPIDYFEKLMLNPVSIQRLLHYPPQFGEISQEEIGIGAHTDYGVLTILGQDEIGGLQVRNRSGEWVSAPPLKGTFIVNIGDFVQTFTNDRYISTTHRVINISGVDRYSLPFFCDLDFDAPIEVVPTCVSEDKPAKYQPYTCGQHKYKRFVDSFPHLKDADYA